MVGEAIRPRGRRQAESAGVVSAARRLLRWLPHVGVKGNISGKDEAAGGGSIGGWAQAV